MAHRSIRLLVLTAAAVTAVAVVAGPALGHGGDRTTARGAAKGALLQAAATYLGVTQADIAAAKRSGQTLAQLAVAKGKTVQGLTDALVAAGKASISEALAAGRITADQAATKTAALPARVQALITSTGQAGCGSRAESASRSGSTGLRRRP